MRGKTGDDLRASRLAGTALQAAGIAETYHGQPWTANCREWVYFACCLSNADIRRRFESADCAVDHSHRGTHDGQEQGFVCAIHHDGIMGIHPAYAAGYPLFTGVD